MNDSQDLMTTIDEVNGDTHIPGEYIHFDFSIGDIVSINGLKCTVDGQFNYGRFVNYLVRTESGAQFTVHSDSVKRWCDA